VAPNQCEFENPTHRLKDVLRLHRRKPFPKFARFGDDYVASELLKPYIGERWIQVRRYMAAVLIHSAYFEAAELRLV
jgi:hypothetical protein